MGFSNIFRVGNWALGKFADGRTRLFGHFATAKGGQGSMEWTPAWADVRDLLVQAVEVERLNEPGSKYLEQFADVAQAIVTKYAALEGAWTAEIRVNGIRRDGDNLLVRYDQWTGFKWWEDHRQELQLAYPLTPEAALRLVTPGTNEVTIVVWNDKIVNVIETK